MALDIKVIDKNTCALSYRDALLALTVRVEASHAAPYLFPPTPSFLEGILGKEMTKVFVFDGGQLIAYAVLKHLRELPGYLAHLDYPGEHSAMIYFTLVHPDYRGRGINSQITALRVAEAKKIGVKYLFSTVHPDNTASLKTLQRVGLKAIDKRIMFDEQLLRFIMFRAL
ncbi:GNAT family N-acetyltransferase [Thalassomonas actiniarum]|uniref:GNAT family N-acetyltransferase n=1 Tax=Thalassomonas actiniarum TaxID=485447 RepID=A0AAE9YL98_9GAMM|nr:GNAT family N-acetyltransferase [Thalassomonas actiniarum]WDD97395.1 GNAT family N-acetyltransferase [Thalassomonas actiniarum]